MIRVFGLIALCVVLVAGCGDSSKPVRRESAAAPANANPQGSMPANPHGMMPSNPHGAMGAAMQAELDSPTVILGSMAMTAPKSWIRLQPSSTFTLAEFQLPRAEGDDSDGRLTITSVGGSIDANFDRWRGQFGGNPDKESREQIKVAGIEFSTISLQGTFSGMHGGMGPAEPIPNYQMCAAIFDVQGRQCIVKCYGPQHTMAKHAESYDAFLTSLDWAKPAGQPASGHPPMSDHPAMPGHPPNSAPPAKPEQAAKPEETKPAEPPAEAKESVKPAEAKEPAKPAEETEPAKPAEAKEPAKPAEETEPAKPAEAKESAKPAEETEPAKPAEAKESAEPAKPEKKEPEQ